VKTLTSAPYRAKRDCQPHRGNSTVPCFQQFSMAGRICTQGVRAGRETDAGGEDRESQA